MKKQAFRTITMLSFLLVLAAVSVNAQRLSDNSIAVNIPFDFAVGQTKLPAGKYTLRRIALPSPTTARCAPRRRSLRRWTLSRASDPRASEPSCDTSVRCRRFGRLRSKT